MVLYFHVLDVAYTDVYVDSFKLVPEPFHNQTIFLNRKNSHTLSAASSRWKSTGLAFSDDTVAVDNQWKLLLTGYRHKAPSRYETPKAGKLHEGTCWPQPISSRLSPENTKVHCAWMTAIHICWKRTCYYTRTRHFYNDISVPECGILTQLGKFETFGQDIHQT